jgi:hypothetical protein
VARKQAPAKPPEILEPVAWTLAPGQPCSFYHEGGHGQKRWVVGWRYGVIHHIPSRGERRNWVQIELRVRRFRWDDERHGWKRLPFERVWVHNSVVNPPGDTKYHGQRLVEEVKERREEKRKQQSKVDKRMKRPVSK